LNYSSPLLGITINMAALKNRKRISFENRNFIFII